MKHISKLFLTIALLFFGNSVFAAKGNMTVNINFVNNTFSSAYPLLYDANDNVILGSTLMQKNGGSVEWSPELADGLYGFGLEYPNGNASGCFQGSEAMVLNPEIYQGDLINIVMSTDPSGNFVCTCTGSACDISVARKH